MAANSTTFTLKLKTEGMDEAQKQTQKIRDNLEAASRTTTGAKKVASSAAASPTGSAGATAGISGSDVEMYNRTRGAAGAAGGTARDFADQARGLGGLVRLYATFAANIFAATAAFGALSRAMDTTNMIRGLDQLGASSGVALGSLSKRLVDATGGAVSLREAMEATVKASSSGISTENILRLGKVAQQASQALGVDATDALSRLTRGITKLEPELLDELGIFTKIDPAVQEYAKSVGKATSELSDFERRLAFTTAVLAEGEKKFSAIEVNANPYNQLLATFKNVVQTGLEVVNNVLGPIAKYLAESPVALGAAIAAFAGIILKQAMPAIGQFRAGLQQTADEAQALSVKKGQEAIAARKTVDTAILANLENTADARVLALDRAEEKIQNINSKSVSKQSLAYKLLKTDITDVTEEQIKAVEAKAKLAEKEGRIDQAKNYREIAKAVREHRDAEADLLAGKKLLQGQYERDAKGLTVFGLTLKAAEAAEKKSVMSRVVSNAAYNSSLIGMSGATKIAKAELDKLGITLSKIEIQFLKLRIGAAVLGGALATLGAIVNQVFAAIAITTVAFTLFDTILSKNGKQLSDFNGSVDRTKSSVETLGDVFDAIRKKSPEQMFNTESLLAVSTAMMEISSATAELIKNTEKLEKASSGWDNFIDSIKSAWGGDRKSKFAESITESTLGALNELGDSPEAVVARKKLANILNIDFSATTVQWEKAYKTIYGNKTALREIDAVMKQLGVSTGNTTSKVQEFDAALKKAGDVQKSFLDKFKVKDELSLLGEEFLSLGIKAENAFKAPETAIQKLSEIVVDNKLLSLFGPTEQSDLLKYKDEIININKAYALQRKELRDLEVERNKLQSEDQGIEVYNEATQVTEIVFKNADKIAALTDQIATKSTDLAKTYTKVTEITAQFPDIAANRLKAGAAAIDAGISNAFAKATGALQNAILGVIGDLPGSSEKRYQLSLKQLDSEYNLIKIQLDLIKSNREIVASNYLRIAKEDESIAASDLRTRAQATGKTVAELQTAPIPEAARFKEAQSRVKEAEQYRDAVTSIGKKAQGSMSSLYKLADAGNSLIKRDLKELADYALQVAGLQAQQLSVRDKKAAETFNNEIGKIKEKALLKQKEYEGDKTALDIARQTIDLNAATGKITQREAIEQTYLNDVQKSNNQLKLQQLDITTKIESLEKARIADPSRTKVIDAEIDLLNKRSKFAQEQTGQAIEASRLATIDKILKYETELLEIENKKQEVQREIKNTQEDTANTIRDIELQTAEQTGKYTEQYLKDIKYQAEVSKIVEESKRKEASITFAYRAEQEKLLLQYIAELQKSGGETTTKSEEIALKMSDNAARNKAQVESIKAVAVAELSKAAAIRKSTEEQELFNTAVSALKGLESIFPAMGTALTSLVGALKDAVIAQDQYNSSREALNKQIAKEPDYNKKLELNKKLSKLENERAKDELSQNANLMGSAKKLFKEKTVAYKAFAAVEKALHIARIAMEFKELFTSLFVEKGKVAASVAGEAGQTAASGAGFLARAGLYVTEIFAKISSQLGVFGPPVAAAIVAAIGLSAFSKKSSAPPKGFSDEEQKSVQGTGETYRNGEKVTRAGALAEDPTARASSVSKSLELVSANTFENLEYSNKMLTALKNIEKNTKGLTSAMMRSIARTPGGVTLPEQIPQGELRGNYIGKGLATAGGAAAGIGIGMGASSLLAGVGGAPLIGGALGALGAGAATALGGLLLPGLGLLFAKPLGKLIGSIFGGQTTQTVETFGIVVKGTLGDIAEGTEGVIQEWANIKNVRKGGWFRRDRTTYSTMEQEAQDPVKDMIRGLFAGVTDALTSAGDVLGKDVSGFLSNYLVKDFKITSKDMKPEELAEAIKGEISIAFNAAAEAAFPEFADFAQPFEEAGETIIRLARQMQVFDFAMMSIGGALSNTIDTQLAAMTKTETVLTRSRGRFGFGFGRVIETTITRPLTEAEIKLEKVKIVDSLIEGAGGMEKFQEKVNFFAENFLTEAERLAPVRQAVTDQLQALGLGFIDSRESFKDYLLAIDLTIPGNIALYNSLMDLAPGIAAIYEAADDARKALSETEMSKKVQDQRIRMLELLGSEANLLEITNIKRKEELAELAKYPKEQADLLIANQKYIYALEDENAIKAKLIKARDLEAQALDKTITAMKSAIDTLKNYRQTLLSGEKSTLTPQQRYQQAQSDFDTLQSIITSSASTTEEKAAAAGKLPAAADKLLESSRTMNASGEKYAQDFDKVLQALNISESILVGQQTDAEKQLKELEKNTSFLGAIDQNTKTTAELSKTTAELLKEYFTARSATEEARSGSATGLSIQAATVGNTQVPVYLDAGQQSPQVITAPTTVAPTAAPVVDVQPLVDEIKVLTEEVVKLRLEQEQQTAQIITTNDQTTQTAAVFIAETNDDLVSNQNFKTRTEFSFK